MLESYVVLPALVVNTGNVVVAFGLHAVVRRCVESVFRKPDNLWMVLITSEKEVIRQVILNHGVGFVMLICFGEQLNTHVNRLWRLLVQFEDLHRDTNIPRDVR